MEDSLLLTSKAKKTTSDNMEDSLKKKKVKADTSLGDCEASEKQPAKKEKREKKDKEKKEKKKLKCDDSPKKSKKKEKKVKADDLTKKLKKKEKKEKSKESKEAKEAKEEPEMTNEVEEEYLTLLEEAPPEVSESPRAKKNVFVRSEEHAWLPARIIDECESKATVQVFDLENNVTEATVALDDYPNAALPLQNVNEYGDMIDLPFLHEAGILYNLRRRLINDRPYTRTGDILIAVNPYDWLDNLFSRATQKRYTPDSTYDPASGMARKSLDPHVYEISALAVRGLPTRNQSILVSGESGAGKTETVKICLDHIATLQADASSKRSRIVDRVVDSNPLLESFGNAKTVRNDNSSRFGKFIQLQFDCPDDNHNSSQLVGSHMDVYLLEKSRVVQHAAGERNFHIFYQLLAAPEEVKREIAPDILEGKTAVYFPYLGTSRKESRRTRRRSSCAGSSEEMPLIDNMSDVQWFVQTVRALKTIGIEDETFYMLMRALCAVLQLGVLRFVGGAADSDHAEIENRSELDKLANLMGIDDKTLSNAFVHKTISVGGTEISSPISPQQAKEGCDAYAKDLYSKTFMWLVGQINAATSAVCSDASTEKEHGIIGVLDVFGFEAFKTNRFEQLCINYANERLQYMFASNVFVNLMDEYRREGLVPEFSYETNSNVLDLIAGKFGILAVLNEECIRPGGSDVEFVYKLLKEHKKSPRLVKSSLFTSYQFGIKHFAGTVIYTAENFLNTNRDTMPIDLQKLSSLSSNIVIAADVTGSGKAAGAGSPTRAAPRGSKLKGTVVSKFRAQLNSLMKTLAETQTRYIRCIKPNRNKEPRAMENLEVTRQLRSGGVIAAIQIASASYPNKMAHHAVLKRFRNLGTKPDPSKDVATQISTLLDTALAEFVSPIKGGTPKPPTTLGKTQTYFRTGVLEYLENHRNANIGFFAIIIQRSYRMVPIRRNFLKLRRAAVKIQALVRGFVWKRRCEKMPGCALKLQCWYRVCLAKQRTKKQTGAITIQQKWCAVREVFRLERRTRAAICIQKVARGSVQRPKFREELEQSVNAAVHLQKTVRRHLQLVRFRELLKRRNLAVVRIQSVTRGSIQRTKFAAQLERKRIADAKKKEMERIAAERKAEEERIAAQNLAEEERVLAEKRAAEKAAEEERLAAEKQAKEERLLEERLADEKIAKEQQLAAEKHAEEERILAKKLAAQKAAEDKRLEAEKVALEEAAATEKAIQKAQEKAAADNAAIEPSTSKDEELELAMEMALLAAQNPHLKPEEINKVLGKASSNNDSGSFASPRREQRQSLGSASLLWRKAGQLLRSPGTPRSPGSPGKKIRIKAPAGLVISAPWMASPKKPSRLSRANSCRSLGGGDDDTLGESVCSMMIPDDLTAEDLRHRREKLRLEQAIRKLDKKIGKNTRELERRREKVNTRVVRYVEKKKELSERQDSANDKCQKKLENLPYDDREVDTFTGALEKVSVKLGLGTFEEQKSRLNEEEKMEFDVQTLQEAQLVRHIQQMQIITNQMSLLKKHGRDTKNYLKSCHAWLSDQTGMHRAFKKVESLNEERKTLYEEILQRQEAALAKHDADMTFRESIEDIF